MDRERLFRHLEQRYSSKREMISRIPLGTQADALWQELLSRRRAKSTVLPIYSCFGLPYWYVTTDKMVSASEKIVDALFENETDFDPYTEAPPVASLEEVFYTSFVDGSQMTMRLMRSICVILSVSWLTGWRLAPANTAPRIGY